MFVADIVLARLFRFRAAVALAAIVLAGCSTVAVSSGGAHVVYERRGVAVCASPCLHATILAPADKACDNEPYLELVRSGLGTLFESGRVTPAQLYAAFPGSSHVTQRYGRLPKTAWVEELLESDRPLVKILNLTERPSNDGKTLVLRLEATRSRTEDGWGSVDFLEIEVVNPRVSVNDDRKGFFRRARVTSLRYTGSMI